MCGIVGFYSLSYQANNEKLCSIIRAMTNELQHRGPDDFGVWVDYNFQIALGHRRLSILDLSKDGHQPMVSESRRYILVYNGEIYNFISLRNQLEIKGYIFRGHSDTEVVLASFEEWGIENAIKKFIGMFALALWDEKEKALFLARDRIGEKPLYYGWIKNNFLFASELKALCAHPDWEPTIDRNSLALYVRYNYIPAPNSIYKNIYKLTPGCILRLNTKTLDSSIIPYWQAKNCAESGINDPYKGSFSDATSELEALLLDVISQEMVADVPLGAFLSGGIDSSTIVALMQTQSLRPIKTFTIGFDESEYNEAHFAKKVANHLGTDHTELYVRPEEALEVIPKLPFLYDEPFSDSSQIPTFLVSQLARQHVTVSLSGDAGDELFAGYIRYYWANNIIKKFGRLPSNIVDFLTQTIRSVSPDKWTKLSSMTNFLLPNKYRFNLAGDKLYKFADILDKLDTEAVYLKLISCYNSTESVVNNGFEPLTYVTDKSKWINSSEITHFMMYLDLISYLPDDILVKVDRASMGVSLESRIPFLDHRVVEFAWKLPISMKVDGAKGKHIIREILYKYVPKELIERPKTGFGVPISYWLRGPLLDWAESLLNEDRIKHEGYFNSAIIKEQWENHKSGIRNNQAFLWGILMFQAWLELNIA